MKRIPHNHLGRLSRPYTAAAIILFTLVGSLVLILTHAATTANSLEPEDGTLSGAVSLTSAAASSNGYVKFNAAGSSTWTWPATLQNTGPAAGTTFTTMAQRDFTTADNGKTFDGIQINATDPRGIYITGSNITFKNCKIMYTGTSTSENGFLFVGDSTSPKNITFDHCIIDDGNRFEYNIRSFYAQFNIQYSQIRGGSHNIDAAGDKTAGTTINIYRNYIYDYDDKPYDSSPRYQGHAANVYFAGNNGVVNIEENTIIGNRWEACTSGGFSNGPGAGCRDNSSNPPFNGTGSVVVYADEDSNPDKTYIVKHNQISGSSYAPIRFYSGGATIQNLQITNNVYTAQSGYPTFSIEGQIYVFSGTIGSRTVTGNTWGSDTTCYASPSSCGTLNP
jgi:hypothetical protein